MKQLWCPWRLDYILGPKPDSCVFCINKHNDDDNEDKLILYKGQWNFVIMNKFPYTNGHLMVVPYRHVANISHLNQDEMIELGNLLQKGSAILEEAVSASGINIGLNYGEAAGAGVREHLHFHIVPRWVGDSSFMAVFDDVRIMPCHLTTTYNLLKPYFAKL